MRKKLIIFDMDGTITDTLDDLYLAVNYALKLYDYPTRNKDYVRKSLGHGLDYLLRCSVPKNIPEKEYEKISHDFRSYYKLHSQDNTKPYKGMVESLSNLKQKGYILAVATNKAEIIAKNIIDKLYSNTFETVCGDDGIRAKKPSSEPIKEIMNRLNIFNLEEVIYIGDSEVDYETAKNSKIDCLLVTYGYRSEKELLDLNLKNTKLIHSPEELALYFK